MILATLLALCPVERVADGDTFTCGGERIRIEGIDAPEINGRCPSERALAIRARQRLSELLRGQVTLSGNRRDRYGRALRRVVVNGVDVGEALIEEGYARVWRGRREPWCGAEVGG